MNARPPLIVVILVVAAAIRLVRLDDAPPGIHHDEATNGYDAYSILNTGQDRWSQPWPVLLEAFGRSDQRGALYAYLVIPWEVILGPDKLTLATRLPAATLGILTILALYTLVRRTHDHPTALWAASFLAVSPWHIQLSRFGHEASLTPAVTVMGLALLAMGGFPFVRAPGPSVPVRLRAFPVIGAAVVFASALYSYPSMRLFTPVFLVAGVICYRESIIALLRTSPNRRVMVSALAVAAAVATPIVCVGITAPDRFFARAAEVSLFHRMDSMSEAMVRFAGQYVAHFSPRWLFVEGDTFPVQSPPGAGQLSLVTFPFLLIGVYVAWRDRRRNHVGRLMLSWLAIYPVASAGTYIAENASTHALRAACGLPLFQWLAAMGLCDTVSRFGTLRRRRSAVIALSLAVASNGAYVVRDYFVRWSRDPWVKALYQGDLRDALRAVRPVYEDYDRVYISDQVSKDNRWFSGESYIHVLLILPVDPARFQSWPKSVRYLKPTDGFHRVDAFGPFVMTTAEDILAASFQEYPNQKALFLARPGEIRGGVLLNTIAGLEGEARFEIISVQAPSAP